MGEDKIHGRLLERMRVTRRGFERFPIIVKYRPDTIGTRALIADVTPGRTYSLIPAAAAIATVEAIGKLSDDPAVVKVWYDEPVHTMLDVSVPLVGAPVVWQAGYTGKGIKVAIVDTGIDAAHPDFAGRIAAFKDFTGEGAGDGHGHGTHVASISAGSGAASNGKYRGVAPEATLYVARVLSSDGSGSMSDVMAGVEWAVLQGAQVINLSLGSDGACDGTDALSETCDAAVNKGAVVCVAAGNAGPDRSTVGSPGCARLVVTIGATNDNDQVTDFSSRGPTSDGRVKPDVCFPGAGIIAARAQGTSMGTPVDDRYTSASGTSMATPHASGAAALLLQANAALKPAAVKDLLMRTAKDLRLDPNTQGKGRAQVDQAYQNVGAPVPTPTEPPVPPPPRKGCLPAVLQAFVAR